nr:GTPase [Halomicronema hongdechloris]
MGQAVLGWFNISDERVAEILAAVRDELPVTEALLIGKPQSGKSSLVRGLTGVSAAIVGQGFRPHTQHTERYAYPSEELPLLIFTDTVGLGEAHQDMQALIQELIDDLRWSQQQAHILILTVKGTDFAVDTLLQLVSQIKQAYPRLPCLLTITCLHELYPPEVADHPDYPPQFEPLQRASETLRQEFQGICDRTVLIDFTLEEDGYTPVFYGLEALRDTLADLLPEAEARAIYQLLEAQDSAAEQLGNLYRRTSRRYISTFAIMAATLAAVPLPFATMPVLTALQVSMVGLLGKLYGQTLSPSQAGGVISAIAGGFLAQVIGRELIKFIPVFGSVVAASWAAAYTWALGKGPVSTSVTSWGEKKPDPQRIQAVMQDAFEAAKQRFRRQDP